MADDDRTELADFARQAERYAVGKEKAPELIEVEVGIHETVYLAAMKRAVRQRRKLAAVARAILFLSAVEAEPLPGTSSLAHRPPKRPYLWGGSKRKRLRFSAPEDQYEAAKARLAASGRSRDYVVEEGLKHYARTGQIEPCLPPIEPQQ